MLTRILSVLLILLCNTPSLAKNVQIVIIVDDIGYQRTDLNLVALPYALTFAILPHTPFAQQAAALAQQQQNDVMLHIPMEASTQNPLGPAALTQEMTRQEIHHTLHTALAEIPFAIGINNHMGSLFTSLQQPMAWTMEYLQQQQLFFVDSLTTPHSTAKHYAQLYQVPFLTRHVFLDNEQTQQAIEQQFQLLLQVARKQQYAIAIAHPYPETYRFLQQRLSKLEAEGVELVGISALLSKPEMKNAAEQKQSAAFKVEE